MHRLLRELRVPTRSRRELGTGFGYATSNYSTAVAPVGPIEDEVVPNPYPQGVAPAPAPAPTNAPPTSMGYATAVAPPAPVLPEEVVLTAPLQLQPPAPAPAPAAPAPVVPEAPRALPPPASAEPAGVPFSSSGSGYSGYSSSGGGGGSSSSAPVEREAAAPSPFLERVRARLMQDLTLPVVGVVVPTYAAIAGATVLAYLIRRVLR